jgi:hypothetical protein
MALVKHVSWRDMGPLARTGVVTLSAVEVGLAVAAWTDLARRPASQVRGPKWRWALAVLVNIFGPLAYFRWGRIADPGTPPESGGP